MEKAGKERCQEKRRGEEEHERGWEEKNDRNGGKTCQRMQEEWLWQDNKSGRGECAGQWRTSSHRMVVEEGNTMGEATGRAQRRNIRGMNVICSPRTSEKWMKLREEDWKKESQIDKIERVWDMLPTETSKQGEKDPKPECDPSSLSSLPLSSTLLPHRLSLLLSCCVMLDCWVGKSPKSALLKAFPLLSCFSHYALIPAHKMENVSDLTHPN